MVKSIMAYEGLRSAIFRGIGGSLLFRKIICYIFSYIF